MAYDFRDRGVPLIRLAGLKRGAGLLSGCNWLDPVTVARKWSHFRLKVNDVLLSTSASLGEVAVVDEEAAEAIPYTGIIRFRPRDERVLPEFIRYALISPFFQAQIESMGVGSVIRHFGPMHLREMRLELPPVSAQAAISELLGALDDKIDLNRRMNRTLEQLAAALFKSWFIDFDPVRAKMEGRQPFGMGPDTGFLFPDSLDDSELGEIPSGWLIRPIDEIATFLNGLALQNFPPDGAATLPVLKIAQLRQGHTLGADQASAAIPSRYVVEDGDLVFSWSGSLEVRIWCGGPAALNQHLFKVSSERFPKWFYYSWILRHLPEFRAIAAGKATTMGHIQRHHLSEALVIVPPPELLTRMTDMIEPLMERSMAAELESRTLIALRDTLLPKLLSGELRVRDAERELAAVM